MQTGEAQAALDDWAEATKIRPDSAAVLQPLIERAEGMLDGSIKPPQPTGHPPAGRAYQAGTHPRGRSKLLRLPLRRFRLGCLRASPSTSLTVRRRAQAPSSLSLRGLKGSRRVAGGGQAADRGHLPVEVTLTNADMMMGGTLPQAIDVTVRADGDGDLLTKNDGVRGQASGVIVGGKTASLTLAPVPQKAQ